MLPLAELNSIISKLSSIKLEHPHLTVTMTSMWRDNRCLVIPLRQRERWAPTTVTAISASPDFRWQWRVLLWGARHASPPVKGSSSQRTDGARFVARYSLRSHRTTQFLWVLYGLARGTHRVSIWTHYFTSSQLGRDRRCKVSWYCNSWSLSTPPYLQKLLQNIYSFFLPPNPHRFSTTQASF
jgi:hypothetical protein